MPRTDYTTYKVDVPEGVSGDWGVRRIDVSQEDSDRADMMAAIRCERRGRVPAGSYTQLICGKEEDPWGPVVVMSDTPDEVRDHLPPIRAAERLHGNVLITGLGLGMVANAILDIPQVERVTIIERSSDVISLVAPHYKDRFGDRLEVIEADAMEWRPARGTRFSVVWHDIWTYICADNLEQMRLLHRRYARRSEWQGSWCRRECQSRARRGF